MDAKYWKCPVELSLPGEHNHWTITASLYAVNFLEGNWAGGRGPRYWVAWRACRRALKDQLSCEEARLAFVSAASEAGILSDERQHGGGETYRALLKKIRAEQRTKSIDGGSD